MFWLETMVAILSTEKTIIHWRSSKIQTALPCDALETLAAGFPRWILKAPVVSTLAVVPFTLRIAREL